MHPVPLAIAVLLAAAGCARPVTLRVEWPAGSTAPLQAFPDVCLPEPLKGPPEDLDDGRPDPMGELLDETFWRYVVHVRDLDPFFAYLREMAAQLEDFRTCLRLLEEQRQKRGPRTGGVP